MTGPERITVHEAAARTRAGSAVLLDVREDGEWAAGHAPEAVHLPLSALAEQVPLPAAARGREPAVICRSGNRSQRAAALPRGRGGPA